LFTVSLPEIVVNPVMSSGLDSMKREQDDVAGARGVDRPALVGAVVVHHLAVARDGLRVARGAAGALEADRGREPFVALCWSR
jgi:hypothetical protein